jgi:hypothetical protein
VHPFHANQLYSNTFLTSLTCGEPWLQFQWQSADRISREELARVIKEAERRIANEVGYNLLPDWAWDERKRTVRPTRPELFNLGWTNARGQRLSTETLWGHVISGGIRASDAIETGVSVNRTDTDGDNYSEEVTATVTTTVTDPNEIRAYYPGESGADAWEIRPINVSISGTTATITFKSWQIVKPDLTTRISVEAIDAEDDNNYLDTIDVYRVYNDPQTMVNFLWEPQPRSVCGTETCVACTFGTQTGCLMVRDPRLGIMTYWPAEWDAADADYDEVCPTICRQPDQVRLYYYSGNEDKNLTRSRVEMEDYWKYAVAYYAASLLDREVCDCENVRNFVKRWQVDRARAGRDQVYTLTTTQADNNLGTREGAIYALNCIRQPGRKIGR